MIIPNLTRPEAKKRGRPLEQLRREFLFQRFLALLFSRPQTGWVLKGGAGLLMRLAGARSSKDLDLLHLGELQPQDAIAELRELTAACQGDHITFVIGDTVRVSGINPVVEISVTSYIGAQYGNFSIDLSTDLHLLAAPERIRPTPVVGVPGLSELPEIVVCALSDQVADKVCAMYETYGDFQSPSSRYRDLIDLALIVATCHLDADLTSRALAAEATRRDMQLPTVMVSPAESWTDGYGAYARKTTIAQSLHSLDAALEQVGACLNPLLDGSRATGRWIPADGWAD